MDIDKLIHSSLGQYCPGCFSSLMDIDKLIRPIHGNDGPHRFSSLMDIDKLIHCCCFPRPSPSFSSLMDIDKIMLRIRILDPNRVLVSQIQSLPSKFATKKSVGKSSIPTDFFMFIEVALL